MARVNEKPEGFKEKTHGGAQASRMTPMQELKRNVLACLLWEDTFYEGGGEAAKRIADLVPTLNAAEVAALAIQARNEYKLRHVPLFLVREMARHATHRKLVASTLQQIVQRPDELGEFLAMYWKDGKTPIAKQVKKGLSLAFRKFDEYQFSKWDREQKIRLRDVMFMTHPKPVPSTGKWTKQQRQQAKQQQAADKVSTAVENLYKKIAEKALAAPETWESDAAAGVNMKENFETKLKSNKLGAAALLKNLRNFEKYGISRDLVTGALARCSVERILPFRFITAAKHAPVYEREIENAMLRCLEGMEKLPGKTVLIIDLSGSMDGSLSAKSELSRKDAAIALSILAQEMCEKVYIYATAGNDCARVHATKLVPARRGFGLKDAMNKANEEIGGGGIFLKQCMDFVYDQHKEDGIDRVIVFTDEQDCDQKCNPATARLLGKHNYIVNVSNNKNGVGYEKWTKIDGFSEATLKYILEVEKAQVLTQ